MFLATDPSANIDLCLCFTSFCEVGSISNFEWQTFREVIVITPSYTVGNGKREVTCRTCLWWGMQLSSTSLLARSDGYIFLFCGGVMRLSSLMFMNVYGDRGRQKPRQIYQQGQGKAVKRNGGIWTEHVCKRR